MDETAAGAAGEASEAGAAGVSAQMTEAATGEAATAEAMTAQMTLAERRRVYQQRYREKRRERDPAWADRIRENNRAYRVAHYLDNREAILAAKHAAAVERGGGVARRGRPRLPPRCPPPVVSDTSASGAGVKESPP